MKPEEPNNNVSFEKAKRRLKWKKLFAKKWFFPAVYLSAAAVILSIAWWYQSNQLQQVSKTKQEGMNQETALPVDQVLEEESEQTLGLPFPVNLEVAKKMNYYDEAGSQETKETSLVNYANTYFPHSGIDFARKDGKTFEVVAAMDGKVMRAQENPILGYEIEIQHENGLTTVYQSLENVKVTKGSTVKKGDVLANAGQNNFEKEAGKHLHFEVRNKDGETVNPSQFFAEDLNG
ncbi:M23 family metallopeptidase [Hazenella sp. IB182357]|uniref:M23 family metallopeptidase n=1 Tax=Polycladospora coralii TaxID=2771432 RepID=A0A926N5W1_9BACL|nr:M23 family metallopeptidase [Polycladospora coralii]MBD1372169.1 M23 family metallopeptidase [Polycladospora coralii]MBS7530668.1 M23 family metallopeptidase [Polycladospora coralii]